VLLARGPLGLLLACLLYSCATQTSVIDETDPFMASKRHLADRDWEQAIQIAESLLQKRKVSDRQLTASIGDLTERAHLATGKDGIVGSIQLKTRNRIVLERLRTRQEMYERVAKWPQYTFPRTTTDKISFTWPLERIQIVSGFGIRLDPFGSEKHMFHSGIDLRAAVGAVVHSPADGQIITAGYRKDGCGLAVTIAHPNDYVTDYCHLLSVSVKPTQRVKQNDVVGRVGITGRSLGPHLHWSLWHRGMAIDPATLVSNKSRKVHAK
jgi:murein DD-endopeptidase MepM/ murein hydrolase activator NlpD